VADAENEIKHVRTFWGYFRQGFVEAHKRRPHSFYLLLLIPVVLLLGIHMSEYRESPFRFASLLTLMLVFFLILAIRACNDLFMLYRKHRSDRRTIYLDTIGNRDFVEKLGKQMRCDSAGKDRAD
jgi:uncharacterized membrane protein YesL